MNALSDFYFAHPLWVWLAVAALFLAVEVGTGTGWLLWPAGAAAIVGVLTFVLPNPAIEVAVFAALTIVSALLARRFLPQDPPKGGDINDNIGRIVGQRGVSRTAFVAGRGRVMVDGKEWAAEADPAEALEPGQAVVALEVLDGARLRVRPA